MSNTEIKLRMAQARLTGMALAASTAASVDADYMRNYLNRLQTVAEEADLLFDLYNEELQNRQP
jgi:hypothetical protein